MLSGGRKRTRGAITNSAKIKEVYKKYEAMDVILSHEKTMKSAAFGQVAYYLWQAK